MQVIKQLKKLPARKTKKHQHAHFRYEKILNKTGCSEVIKKDKLNKSEKKKHCFCIETDTINTVNK